jgi:hypothetical protein
VGLVVPVADEHEAASAEVAGEGVGDSEGEAYRYSCIYGITASFEDGDAGVTCVVLDAGDHSVGGAGGLEAGLLGQESWCWEEGGGAEKRNSKVLGGAGSDRAQGIPPTAWLLSGEATAYRGLRRMERLKTFEEIHCEINEQFRDEASLSV